MRYKVLLSGTLHYSAEIDADSPREAEEAAVERAPFVLSSSPLDHQRLESGPDWTLDSVTPIG